MNRFFLRALGIISLKTLAMTLISVMDLLYVAQYVPVKVHALVMGIVLLLVTFLFAEWILYPTPHISPRRFAAVVVVTYLWDAFFGALLWSFLLSDARILYVQSLLAHLLAFALFTLMFAAAWWDRKRLSSPSVYKN
jgi:hypothetical protein